MEILSKCAERSITYIVLIIHFICSTMHNVHTVGYENLEAGQRIQVSGTLRCDPFKTENGKVRERLYIRANQIVLLEDQQNTPAVDCNHIDIVGNVAKKVIEIDHFSIIKLANHYNRG